KHLSMLQQMDLLDFSKWVEMQRFYIIQQMKRKKDAMHSRKRENQISINSLVFLKIKKKTQTFAHFLAKVFYFKFIKRARFSNYERNDTTLVNKTSRFKAKRNSN